MLPRKLTITVEKNRVSVAYEVAVPHPPQTRRAMAVSDLLRMTHMLVPVDTAAGVVAATTGDAANLAPTAGRTTAQTTIALLVVLAEDDGRRTRSSSIPRPWATTIDQTPLTYRASREEEVNRYLHA
jgi:hypothetical protein